jgi:hypothetical protein
MPKGGRKMKKFIFFVILILLVAQSCVNLPSDEIGLVRFQVSTGEQLRALYAIEDAHSLIVSIEDSEGGVVYDRKNILLYKMGEGFISEPLALEVGEYRLTEFLVLDDQGQVIFATPIEGSEKAYLVDDPLPIEFIVSKDEVTTVIPEVLDTEGAIPEDFGYSGFSFEVVETFVFLVSVFVVAETGMELTEAELTVRSGVEVLYSGSLGAKTNAIEVRDGYVMYNVMVEKDGYESYEQSFTDVELRGCFENPLNIYFGEALTYSISGRVFYDTVSAGVIGFREVTMTLSGAATGTATTDASGNYTFSGLTEGESYTVSPSKPGYSFSPDWSGTLVGDVTEADFTATTGSSYSISGYVNNWRLGGGVSDAEMALDTVPALSVFTDSWGNYTTISVPNGTYTLIPNLSGSRVAFYPPEKTVTVADSNLFGEYFDTTIIHSVSGTISHSGAKTGRVYINVIDQGGWGDSNIGTSIEVTGPGLWPFTIRGVEAGTYTLDAFMDNLGSGARNASNPTGNSAVFTVVDSDITGQSITLTDPGAIISEVPEIYIVFPANQSAAIMWEGPTDINDLEIAQSYNVYWSTDPYVSKTVYDGMANAPSMEDTFYIATGLTDGSDYYFVVTAIADGIESIESTTFGPVTIGATMGDYTISGTITFSQAATGPMYVIVYNEEGANIYFTYIASAISPQSYSISGVPADTWFFFVFLDMNDNGQFDIGEFFPDWEDIEIVLTGNMTQNLTIGPLVNASVNVRTWHNEWGNYSLNFDVSEESKHVVKASLVSGPHIPGIIDFGYDEDHEIGTGLSFYSTRPNVGDTYSFDITYSDSTTETLHASVTAVLDSFATPISPVGSVPGATHPTFTWAAPAPPPPLYEYGIGVWEFMGGQIWWNDWLPSSETSVEFNFDDEAEQDPLTPFVTYSWQIKVIDQNGNMANSNSVEFTP